MKRRRKLKKKPAMVLAAVAATAVLLLLFSFLPNKQADERVTVPIETIDEQRYASLDPIIESLGGSKTVSGEEGTQTAVYTAGAFTLEVTEKEAVAVVNGQAESLTVVENEEGVMLPAHTALPVFEAEEVLVPVEFMERVLGLAVEDDEVALTENAAEMIASFGDETDDVAVAKAAEKEETPAAPSDTEEGTTKEQTLETALEEISSINEFIKIEDGGEVYYVTYSVSEDPAGSSDVMDQTYIQTLNALRTAGLVFDTQQTAAGWTITVTK